MVMVTMMNKKKLTRLPKNEEKKRSNIFLQWW